jgi:uncharacterized protein
MEKEWVGPNIIIGNVAVGSNYFNRKVIVNRICAEIKKGQHVLLAAPRRVGKTSIMEHIASNCAEGFICICENVQSVPNDNELYKRLFTIILNKLDGTINGLSWFSKFKKQLNITEISKTGVRFGEKKELNYAEELFQLFEKIVENDLRIVLLIDELPEVLMTLYKKGESNIANHILDQLREWRQHTKFLNHITFVLAGSVGIHHIVKLIDGRVKDINDIHKIDFEVFSSEEAIEYIDWATKNATVQYLEELKDYLIAKIGQPIPYFINLMLNELDLNARKLNNPILVHKHIDEMFEKVVRVNDYFEEWYSRLYQYFEKPDADFMNEILIHIAHKGGITIKKLYDIAVKRKKTTSYMFLINELENDGYIFMQQETYHYISPFLKLFWKNTNPIYNG